MVHLLRLVLPIVVPSWRFFKTIEPSPRIEWAEAGTSQWRLLFPPPDHLPLASMVARLLWNAQGNEALFMISCAERVLDTGDTQAMAEIMARVTRAAPKEVNAQFRIRLVDRIDADLQSDVLFVSDPFEVGA